MRKIRDWSQLKYDGRIDWKLGGNNDKARNNIDSVYLKASKACQCVYHIVKWIIDDISDSMIMIDFLTLA